MPAGGRPLASIAGWPAEHEVVMGFVFKGNMQDLAVKIKGIVDQFGENAKLCDVINAQKVAK